MFRRGPSQDSHRYRWWVILATVALATRFWGAFFFPNAEADGYSDAETIARFSHAFAHGTFHLADLYGFWLPLFQVVAALLNLFVHNPLLAGKIVSAATGAVSCLLAFGVTLHLTHSRLSALFAFAMALASPIHFIYSSACMTDVPFGCLILASLLYAFKGRWDIAAIFAAVSGGVRVEGWVLVPLLPLLQFLKERRVTWFALFLVLPPLLWLFITHLARGHWMAFFDERVLYHEHYIEFHPSRRGFAWSDISMDTDNLLFGANRVAFLAAPVAACLLLWPRIRRRAEAWNVFVTIAFFAAILAFLVLGYVTKRQPVWLPRYGLFGLVLGAPLLAWILRVARENFRPPRLIQISLAGLIGLLCLFEIRRQYSIVPKILNDYAAHSKVAHSLVTEPNQVAVRCLCDDVATRVLSGLPSDQFIRSSDAPRDAWSDQTKFEAFQRQQKMNYLVLMPTEDSLPAKWYWSAEAGVMVPASRFELIVSADSQFGPGVWLYRARD